MVRIIYVCLQIASSLSSASLSSSKISVSASLPSHPMIASFYLVSAFPCITSTYIKGSSLQMFRAEQCSWSLLKYCLMGALVFMNIHTATQRQPPPCPLPAFCRRVVLLTVRDFEDKVLSGVSL